MKKQSPLYSSILLLTITLMSLISCTNSNLKSSINLDCSSKYKFDNLKNCKEPNGNYAINLPNHYKREFYINESESRIYYADTTKELNQTFITDVGLYRSKKEIDKKFLNEMVTSIEQEENVELTSLSKIVFKEKNGYIFHITENNKSIEKNSIEVYLANRDRSYYFIKIDIYGNENQDERLCEALSIIEGSEFY